MENWIKKGLEAGSIEDVSRYHRTLDDGYVVENFRYGVNYMNVLSREQITLILRYKITGQAVAFTSFSGARADYEDAPLWVH
ncbi:MAG: hypothetical protein JSS38_11160 [Nitrospira sp.]|nr:hypothetical protein [Nitrospira sp.]